jgi:hypothetical protein
MGEGEGAGGGAGAAVFTPLFHECVGAWAAQRDRVRHQAFGPGQADDVRTRQGLEEALRALAAGQEQMMGLEDHLEEALKAVQAKVSSPCQHLVHRREQPDAFLRHFSHGFRPFLTLQRACDVGMLPMPPLL